MARGEPRQRVTPRTSRRITRPRSRNSFAATIGRAIQTVVTFAKPIAILLMVAAAIIGYNVVARSRLFALRTVEVSDAGPALAAEVKDVVRRAIGETRLLDVNLKSLREKIEAMPRVRIASVARVVPDQIHVSIVERKPALLARRKSDAVIWLDEDAVEMGDLSELKLAEGQEIPPITKGFVEGQRSPAAIAEDRERIAVYKQIEREFNEAPASIWNRVDEIDLTFTKDVNLRLANSIVTVHVGSKDFRNRFEQALQVVDAIRQGDAEKLARFRIRDAEGLIRNAGRINFIDAARPDRIVLNFSTPGSEKADKQERKKKR